MNEGILNQILLELKEFKQESRLYWEQNEKRWIENDKRWEDNEEKWKNNSITLANLRNSIKNDMDKMFEAIENIAGKNEKETLERKDDISKLDGRLKLHSLRLNELENKVSNLCN